jgi:hypothetical protein
VSEVVRIQMRGGERKGMIIVLFFVRLIPFVFEKKTRTFLLPEKKTIMGVWASSVQCRAVPSVIRVFWELMPRGLGLVAYTL